MRVLFSVLFTVSGFCTAATVGTPGRLIVHVTGSRNARGLVRVGLWNGPQGFPTNPKMVFQGASSQIVNGDATLVLQHVPPGTYAVSSYHDENSNGKLDTNLVGIPKEEYGFSNGARSKFGPPAFASAKFEFNGVEQTIVITLAN